MSDTPKSAAQRRYDKLEYIRRYYNVPAYKGVRVTIYGRDGVIVDGEGPHLKVRMDGAPYCGIYHPTDGVTYHGVQYLEES